MEESNEKYKIENQNYLNIKASLEQKKQKLELEVQQTETTRKEISDQLRDALILQKQKENELGATA